MNGCDINGIYLEESPMIALSQECMATVCCILWGHIAHTYTASDAMALEYPEVASPSTIIVEIANGTLLDVEGYAVQ